MARMALSIKCELAGSASCRCEGRRGGVGRIRIRLPIWHKAQDLRRKDSPKSSSEHRFLWTATAALPTARRDLHICVTPSDTTRSSDAPEYRNGPRSYHRVRHRGLHHLGFLRRGRCARLLRHRVQREHREACARVAQGKIAFEVPQQDVLQRHRETISSFIDTKHTYAQLSGELNGTRRRASTS